MAVAQPADGTERDKDVPKGAGSARGLVPASHLEPSRIRTGSADPTRADEPPSTPAVPHSHASARSRARNEVLRGLKYRLLDELGTRFDPDADLSPAGIRLKIASIVGRQQFVMTREERAGLVDEMVAEMTGLGPIEALLLDDTITEVMVNGPKNVYIERAGIVERVDVVFQDDEHVRRIIDRIVTAIGRRIDETSPRVDSQIQDHLHLHQPVARKGRRHVWQSRDDARRQGAEVLRQRAH